MKKTIETEEEQTKVSVRELHDYVMQRIEALSLKLSEHGLSASFGASSSASRAGEAATCDMGIAGGLLMDTMILDAVMGQAGFDLSDLGGFSDSEDMNETFNNVAIVAGEAVSMLRDDRITEHRYRVVNSAYPQGRRKAKCALNKKMANRFNKAANQNVSFSGNPEAELMEMYEILEKLDALLKQNVQKVFVEEKQSVTEAINRAYRARSANAFFFAQKVAV